MKFRYLSHMQAAEAQSSLLICVSLAKPLMLTHNNREFNEGSGLRGYKTFFILNSAEDKIYPAHKCLNANNCWHFNIY